ncbi:MAG: hypothetical protein ACR2NN_20450 [Bryobacteraceae bacterium]
MDATLHDLGGLLLKAIPTLILLVVVNLYLKWMFFRPLEGVLAKRREMTEGARESAKALLQRASEKTADYEAKLREARAEIYREQEETRRRSVEDQTKRIEEARQHTQTLILQAKVHIAKAMVAAQQELSASSESLADQIVNSLLRSTGILAGVVLLSVSAFAQEAGAKPETAAPEMSGWMWVNFAILIAGLGYLAFKNAPALFRARDQEIRRGIDEASAQKALAQERASEIDQRLAGLEAEIGKLREGVTAEMAAESERLRQDTERLLRRIEEQAQQEIGFLTKAASQQLKTYSAGLALDLAAQRIQQRMNRETQHALAGEFISGLRRAGLSRN